VLVLVLVFSPAAIRDRYVFNAPIRQSSETDDENEHEHEHD